MECGDPAEVVLCGLGQGKGAVRRPESYFRATPIKRSKGVFESDAELADDTVFPDLLLVLVKCEVFDSYAAAVVADMPASIVVLDDADWCSAAECAFVEGIGDDLTEAVLDFPVLQHCLDIEIK